MKITKLKNNCFCNRWFVSIKKVSKWMEPSKNTCRASSNNEEDQYPNFMRRKEGLSTYCFMGHYYNIAIRFFYHAINFGEKSCYSCIEAKFIVQ